MSVRLTRGMVTAPHPTATQAGLDILTAGGTAIDAAVAAAFTLAVVTPASTGIAGFGGCLLMYLAEQSRVVALSFMSRAPAAARDDMFVVREDGSGGFTVENEANAFGPLAVDVPGTVAGLTLLQDALRHAAPFGGSAASDRGGEIWVFGRRLDGSAYCRNSHAEGCAVPRDLALVHH